ncbi:hypothetical protein DH2020_027361 [Rehmannia glutinosa]|uniref:Cytochrome P450 protein n=1 Tax=Rehmannia glutinosa TaxID=99300 RepID=A0ABR0VXA4_REHGL
MDPDVIREVMTKYHTYHKSYKTSNEIAKMVVTGLINKEGEEWAKARMKLNPAFHLEKLKPMVPAIQVCSQNTLNEWKEMAAKGGGFCCFDVYPYLEVFTSSALARLMFDSTYTEQLKQTFLQLSELAFMGKLATNPLTLPGEKKEKGWSKACQSGLTGFIHARIVRENSNDVDRQRIIDDIIGQCKLFFFAGYETNSNLLTWTMIMLSAHQDWQARAREEAVQVLGNKKEITSEDLGKLKIATMILNEMLRLFPSSMEFTRLVEEETTLGGYTIPKDTLVTCPIIILQRSTEIWGKDAGERFAEGIVKATKGENVYMPFGWGPRICIAQNFAFLESKTFLAMLLLNFTFELSPTYVHAPFVDFTIHPQYGAPIVLKKL